MACNDENDLPEEECEFWDEDGCYCVCGAMCLCVPFHPGRQRFAKTEKLTAPTGVEGEHTWESTKDGW